MTARGARPSAGGRVGWRPAAGMLGVLVAGVVLGACSSGPPSATTSTTMAANSTLPDITKAVVTYQSSQGVARSRYLITGISVSTVDPNWARFAVGPTAADRASFQAGYGFVHLASGVWRVSGFGSAEVGCPLTGLTTPAAATYVPVPAAVLAAFGLPCPPESPTGSTTTTTAGAPAPTATAASPVAAITTAVDAYQLGQGLQPGQYTITGISVSTVDPDWARFSVGPTPADRASFQGGYGFAHRSDGYWSVVGFGSAGVGCLPGAADNQVVPAPVLAGFDLSCTPGTP